MYQGLSLDQAPPYDIPFRFFLTAPLFLVLFGLLLFWQGAELFQVESALPTLALVHLFTIGWLTLIMMGAFYQMIPVMVGGKVPYLELSRWVHTLVVFGLFGLLCFFIFPYDELLLWPFFSLALGFGLFLLQLAKALAAISEDRPTLSAMRASVVSLFLVVLLGLAMLGEFATWWSLPFSKAQTRELHLIFGLFGWVGLLIIGVSFHIIPLFFVTPLVPLELANRILLHIYISLFLLTVVIVCNFHWAFQVAASLLGLFGLGSYITALWRLLDQRRRMRPDPTVLLWRWGLFYFSLFGLGALGLMVPWFNFAPLHFIILFAFGGATLNITCGMLFKIVPFLVWFHRFSSQIRQDNVPMLGDLLTPEAQFRFANQLNVTLGLFFLTLVLQSSPLLQLMGLGWTLLGFIFWRVLFQVTRYNYSG